MEPELPIVHPGKDPMAGRDIGLEFPCGQNWKYILIVIYTEMIVETTKACEISQEDSIKNENRTLKMFTVKK